MNNHDYEFWADNSVKAAWEERRRNSLCNIGMLEYDETVNDFSAIVENIVNDDTCATVFFLLASYQ